MAETLNQQIADAMTDRQLRVRRAERRKREEILAILALLEADLLAALKRVDPFAAWLLAARLRAAYALVLDDWTPLVETAYVRIAAEAELFVAALAAQEVPATQAIVEDISGADVLPETPGDRAVRRRVAAVPFPSPQRPTDFSTTGAEWWRRQSESLRWRLSDQLRVSVTLGETLTEAAQRVRGTPEQGFEDGIMQRARDDAVRLLTTQTTNAVSEAHTALGDANAETAILIHSSILDGRTSTICLARHGLRYQADTHEGIGHRVPYLNGPPYHPHCRSTMLVGSLRGGPIPDADLDAWLQRQSEARQNDILGPTRARLWREGRLSPRDLIDAATGRPLTLDELGVH